MYYLFIYFFFMFWLNLYIEFNQILNFFCNIAFFLENLLFAKQT